MLRSLLRRIRRRFGRDRRTLDVWIPVPDLPHAAVLSKESLEKRTNWNPLGDGDLVWRPCREETELAPEDPVLVVHGPSRGWILPWSLIGDPHVANLNLDGRPVMVAVCRLCSSGMAFDPVVSGQPLTFRVVGRWNGGALIGDRETGSCWSPFTGEAVSGPLKGGRLGVIPLVQGRWGQWAGVGQEYLVASRRLPASAKPSQAKFGGLWQRELHEEFRKSLMVEMDVRLPKNSPVVGVWHGGEACGYPLAFLERAGPCVNDRLGGTEIVLFHLAGSLTALAYERRTAAGVLEFAAIEGEIRDRATGSVWDFQGQAVSGPLAGHRLAFVPSVVQEWYIWAASHPATDLRQPSVG